MFFGIFGWGKKSRRWPIGEGKELVATWSYFSLNFVALAWAIHWYVIGENRSEDREVTYDEVKALFPQNTPHLTSLEQYGLWWVIGATALLVIYAFANRQW
ncbi:MAG: hypothetical protein V4467_03650 [Patescibacteria group bacterium]